MRTIFLEYKDEEEYDKNAGFLPYNEFYQYDCKHEPKDTCYIFTTYIWVGGFLFPAKRYHYTMNFCKECSQCFDEEFKEDQDKTIAKIVFRKEERLAFSRVSRNDEKDGPLQESDNLNHLKNPETKGITK